MQQQATVTVGSSLSHNLLDSALFVWRTHLDVFQEQGSIFLSFAEQVDFSVYDK